MRTYLDPSPCVMLAGNRVRSSTTVAAIGAYHVGLATVLPDRGVELHSFYTGHDRLGETSVTHLLLAPGARELRTEPWRNAEIPVMWARRRCLYDPGPPTGTRGAAGGQIPPATALGEGMGPRMRQLGGRFPIEFGL